MSLETQISGVILRSYNNCILVNRCHSWLLHFKTPQWSYY